MYYDMVNYYALKHISTCIHMGYPKPNTLKTYHYVYTNIIK